MAEVRRRAQIAYCTGPGVSVLFERGGKAVHVRSAETRAQAFERPRRDKVCLQHRVLLLLAVDGQITVALEDPALTGSGRYASQGRSHRNMPSPSLSWLLTPHYNLLPI